MRRSVRSSRPLVGREGEIHRLEALLAAAAAGSGGALVLRGEAGIGKSTLLDHLVETAESFRCLRASGSEFEAELPFAVIHQLCLPILDGLDDLAPPYRDSLRVAFGEALGTPDPLRVGMAVLHLLAARARSRPVLCAVDDAQWLDDDSRRVLVFLARRISAERLALVLATREGLDEIPGIEIAGLRAEAARELLDRSRATLDEQVRCRLLAEADGNPLALLELPGAGGFALPDPHSVPNRIEQAFAARAAELPDEVELLLILAGAEPTGDPNLLWAAAAQLGIGSATAAAAEASGLLTLGARIRFCHPLARSGVYRTAEPEQRHRAHRALAAVTDPVTDPDRRAWHRAQSGTGPDEEIAAELDRSAARASARGGVAAAAAFRRRAAELSVDPARRTERALAAVAAEIESGALDPAGQLLSAVATDADNPEVLARTAVLRGRIDAVLGSPEGPASLLRAAAMLTEHDPALARESYLDAVEQALVLGRAHGVRTVVLAAARAAPPVLGPPDILDALIRLFTAGHAAAAEDVHAIVSTEVQWRRRPVLAAILSIEMWDFDTATSIIADLVRTSRESGSALGLRLGLGMEATTAAHRGDPGAAIAAIAEEAAVADALGAPAALYPRLHLAALRGDRTELDAVVAAVVAQAPEDTDPLFPNAQWAMAVVNNGLARYRAALSSARVAEWDGELAVGGLALIEIVESAARCDDLDTATEALAALSRRTVTGTPWGLGVTAYCRALVTGAEDHYREAIEHLRDGPPMSHLGRAHLLYGEWLRRAGRRKEALEHLRSAHEQLEKMGMSAFADRAAAELRVLGDRVRRRTMRSFDQLTEQEVHIARLVATGSTSKEVAARLFLSPRTIDAHLRNIFRKLGITSRRQLQDIPGIAAAEPVRVLEHAAGRRSDRRRGAGNQ